MNYLNDHHLTGLLIGLATFLVIGLFHPLVIKAEYHLGTRCWWMFLALGIGLLVRRRVFIVLEYPRGLPSARTSAQRLVPAQPSPALSVRQKR